MIEFVSPASAAQHTTEGCPVITDESGRAHAARERHTREQVPLWMASRQQATVRVPIIRLPKEAP